MTDRELLEAAAKAAGMMGALTWTPGATPWLRVDPDNTRLWNPLADDGDALRLAVKLGLHISQQLSYVTVCQPHGPAATRGLSWATPYDAANAYAATRRAIVRAAAAVGAA